MGLAGTFWAQQGPSGACRTSPIALDQQGLGQQAGRAGNAGCRCPGLEGVQWGFGPVLSTRVASQPRHAVFGSIATPASFCSTYELLLVPIAVVRASPCLVEMWIHTPARPGLITLMFPPLHPFSSVCTEAAVLLLVSCECTHPISPALCTLC